MGGHERGKAWDEFLNELANMAITERRFKHRKRVQKLLEMGYDETRVRKWPSSSGYRSPNRLLQEGWS